MATKAIWTAVGPGAYDIAIVLSIVTFATLRVMATFKPARNLPDKSRKVERFKRLPSSP